MHTLRSILGDWWLDITDQRDVTAGGGDIIPTLSSRDAARLRTALRRAIRGNQCWFSVIFALAVLLVVMTAVAPFLMDAQWLPGWLRRSTGGGALIFLIILAWLWREITALEMMVVIATYLQGKAMADLVAVVRERLRPWGFKDLDGFVRRSAPMSSHTSRPTNASSED